MMKKFIRLGIIISSIALFLLALPGNAQEREIFQINNGWQFFMADKEIDYVNISDSSWQEIHTVSH